MGKYSIGEVWWTHFPFNESDKEKHRPAIVIDDDTIAILAMYVTSKDKDNPYSIEIEDWKEAGLPIPSWTRIDRIISISEWNMDRKIGNLSDKDLTKIMQLVAEITANDFHEFSLIAIKNPEGKYLQKFDDRWNCWLFPYCKSSENNKENVDNETSELLQMDVTTSYIAQAKHCKYSVSDSVYKIYHHKLYMLVLDVVPNSMSEETFNLNGAKFKWMSYEDMEQDTEIMEKNDDIVAFVKRKCQ